MSTSPPPLSPQQAASTLRDIHDTQRRSQERYGNQTAAPHLIWWGIIWAIGYGLSISPRWAGPAWDALVPIGIVGSLWLGARRAPVRAKPLDPRYIATAVAIFLFFTAMFLVLPPASGEQVGALVPLLVALIYVLLGIFSAGPRMTWTGVAIGVFTVAGYLALPQHFAAWMAVVGGGGLILGGIWMRSA